MFAVATGLRAVIFSWRCPFPPHNASPPFRGRALPQLTPIPSRGGAVTGSSRRLFLPGTLFGNDLLFSVLFDALTFDHPQGFLIYVCVCDFFICGYRCYLWGQVLCRFRVLPFWCCVFVDFCITTTQTSSNETIPRFPASVWSQSVEVRLSVLSKYQRIC